MGRLAQLETNLKTEQMNLAGKKKLLAASDQNVAKAEAEKRKIAVDMKKAEGEVDKCDAALKAAEKAKKAPEIKKAKEELAKANALFDRLSDAHDAANKKWVIVQEAEAKLTVAIAALEREVVAAQQEFAREKAVYTTKIAAMTADCQRVIKTLEATAVLSVDNVVGSKKEAGLLDGILTRAVKAQKEARAPDAQQAVKDAETILAGLAERVNDVDAAIKKATSATASGWTYVPAFPEPAEKPAFMKMSDRRSALELQAENNLTTVKGVHAEAKETVGEIRAAAAGGADLVAVYSKAMERLINRTYALAQGLDVFSRECSGCVDKVEGDLDLYAKAANDKDKATHKGSANDNLKLSVQRLGVYQAEIKKAIAEIDQSLGALPGDVVKPANPAFADKFKAFEKGRALIDQDTEKAVKLSGKIQKATPQVKAMT